MTGAMVGPERGTVRTVIEFFSFSFTFTDTADNVAVLPDSKIVLGAVATANFSDLGCAPARLNP